MQSNIAVLHARNNAFTVQFDLSPWAHPSPHNQNSTLLVLAIPVDDEPPTARQTLTSATAFANCNFEGSSTLPTPQSVLPSGADTSSFCRQSKVNWGWCASWEADQSEAAFEASIKRDRRLLQYLITRPNSRKARSHESCDICPELELHNVKSSPTYTPV